MSNVTVASNPPATFDLGFADAYGPKFARQLASDLSAALAGHSFRSARAIYRGLRGFFEWLGSSPRPKSQQAARLREALLEAMRDGTASQFGVDLFADLCELYAARFRRNVADKKKRKQNYDKGRRFGHAMRLVSGRSALPKVRRGLRSSGADDHERDGYVTLAALTPTGPVDWSRPAHLKRSIARVLRSVGKDPRSMSLSDQVMAVAELNRIRLDRLRSVFELEFNAERAAFDAGQRMLNDPSLPTDNFIRSQVSPGTHSHKWLLQEIGGDVHRGLAIILRYYRASGCIIHGFFPVAFRDFLRRGDVRSALGPGDRTPRELLQRMLSITDRSWHAAFGLLLCHTGWNIQPLLDLDADPIVEGLPDKDDRLITSDVITSFKRRAGHDVHSALEMSPLSALHALDAEGPDRVLRLRRTNTSDMSAKEVLRAVQRMTAPIRSRSSCPTRLWICARHYESAAMVPGLRARQLYLEAFLERHSEAPDIGGLPIRHCMIRKTVIDIATMTSDGGHALGAAIAENNSANGHRKYRGSPWARFLLRENLRAFQDGFEAVLASEVPKAAQHLGLSEAEFRRRYDFAIQSGLSLRGAPARPKSTGQVTARTHSFLPTEQSIRDLHVVHQGLLQTAETLPADHVDSWRSQWLPHLIDIEAVLAELGESPFSAASRRIQREVRAATKERDR